MVGWIGALKTLVDLFGGDSTGAQPFPSFNTTTTVQTANYTASFGETVYANPTAATFTVTLPLITASSKGTPIRIFMRGTPTVGTAAPTNVIIQPNAANSIGGSVVNIPILLSGHSAIVLESDGLTDWIITQVPSVPSTPATLGATPQTLTRQGPYTRVAAPAVLGGASTYTFSNTNAVAGDIYELSIPTHDAYTVVVKNAATTTIATFPTGTASFAGGGRFIFNGTAWEVLEAGGSAS